MNTLYQGDNLTILREMPDASVDLIATDPPFNTGKDWGAFNDKWEGGLKGYLKFMEPRLIECHRVLKDTGSLYLHCDPTASHYLKVMLDGVFGIKQFRNEIVWQRIAGSAKGSQHERRRLGQNTDNILWYSKTNTYLYNPIYKPLDTHEIISKFPQTDENGKRYSTTTPLFRNPSSSERPNLCYEYKGVSNPYPSGWRVCKETLIAMDNAGDIIWREGKRPLRKAYAENYKGIPVQNLWLDIPIASMKERIGYPTQKPRALYERIIKASSNQGDTVLDPFAGSGTTLDAAQTLGRKWIGIDIGDEAITTIEKRLRERHGLLLEYELISD